MGRIGIVANSLALSATLAWIVAAGSTDARPLAPGAADLAALEARAAAAPSVADLSRLSSAYLAHHQPGLAQALLDRHGERDDVELSLARSRVAYARGEVGEALRQAELTHAACEHRAAVAPCPSWVVAKAAHQLAFLEALEAESGSAVPSARDTERALSRATRSVQLVAMR
jgi:hypothetical protein